MPILRILFCFKMARRIRQILLPPSLQNIVGSILERILRQTQRVGSHIGNQTDRSHSFDFYTFVEFLRSLHGAAGLKTQAAGSLLLQRRGDKRRRRRFAARSLFEFGNFIVRSFQFCEDTVRLLFIFNLDLSIFIAVECRRESLTGTFGNHLCINGPILFGNKFADLLLAVHHQPDRYGLYAPPREAPTNLLGKKWAEFIAYKPVQNAPRLLCIDQIHIDAAGMLHPIGDTRLCNLIECHTVFVFCL